MLPSSLFLKGVFNYMAREYPNLGKSTDVEKKARDAELAAYNKVGVKLYWGEGVQICSSLALLCQGAVHEAKPLWSLCRQACTSAPKSRKEILTSLQCGLEGGSPVGVKITWGPDVLHEPICFGEMVTWKCRLHCA